MPGIPAEGIPAEQTGAINKHIAPSVLFYFRYAALLTVITGLVVAHLSGYLFSPGSDLHALMVKGVGAVDLIGLGMGSGYALLGSTWLIIKTTGDLQRRAIGWARHSIVLLAAGVAAVSLATPFVSQRIYEKWFGLENLIVLWPIPVMTAVTFLIAYRSLSRLPGRLEQGHHDSEWIPFASTVAIFMLAFHGLAYSLFPYLVMDRLTIWEAAAAPESLMFIFVGAIIVLPVIVGYSVYAYRVFRGKATDLSYY